MEKDYKVLHITQMTRISEEKGMEYYYRHKIKTKGGLVLAVDIEAKDFIPEKADPILTKEAKNADAIKAL